MRGYELHLYSALGTSLDQNLAAIDDLEESMKVNEKDNETLIALMPILSVEDLYGCIQMIISVSKIKVIDDKDNSLVFRLMKCVSEDPSYNWWQLEYPRELFLGYYSSRSFGSAVLGQMTYLVASSTLDSARSYVMQGASFTQGTVSSIPIGGNISPGGFSPSILLVVILVTVVIVVVVLVVVVIGVVIVVAIIGVVFVVGGVSFIIKLSFVIIGFRGDNISFNASRQSSDESFQEFLNVRYHAWAYNR
ncbi:hypothetical protein Tco_1135844 [Tanacetum coccineum]